MQSAHNLEPSRYPSATLQPSGKSLVPIVWLKQPCMSREFFAPKQAHGFKHFTKIGLS